MNTYNLFQLSYENSAMPNGAWDCEDGSLKLNGGRVAMTEKVDRI